MHGATMKFLPKETLISLSLAFQTSLSVVGSPKVMFYPARHAKTQISHLAELSTVSLKHVAIIKTVARITSHVITHICYLRAGHCNFN
jgi:hypothetical protein